MQAIDPQAALQTLIAFPSVSRDSNADVSRWVHGRLVELGFHTEQVEYHDRHGVLKVNVLGRRGEGTGGLAYFAHTDVVPADAWRGPTGGDAFQSSINGGRMYGRGACDMKGSLAAFLAAASKVEGNNQRAPLTVVCTADEEVGFDGARQVVSRSVLYRQLVAEQPLGIIGEPTRLAVYHAHKGITGFQITSRGRAAHSSTRDGVNANLAMIPMLVELKALYQQTESDPDLQNAAFDPPTLSWNIGVSDGATAINVTPGRSRAWVSLRTMPSVDGNALIDRARTVAESLGLEFEMLHGGSPLWVDPQRPRVQRMCALAGCATSGTVCYATDGGEFTELEDLVICGPGDIAQAHTDDEWIDLDQLQRGAALYEQAIREYCNTR